MLLSKPCTWCQRPITFMTIRGGKSLPFEPGLVEFDKADGSGWVPVRGQGCVYMRPTKEVAPSRLERVKQVVVLHRCPEYEMAKTGSEQLSEKML